MRTTGMSSITALGRPFHELVEESSAVTGMNSLMNMHNKVLTVKSDSAKKDSLARKVAVVPVGPNAENMTHFTLKLEDSCEVQLSNYGGPTPPKGLSIQVHA
jgi:ribulose-5-phosphate 4-epimerase/fuculose-1-phosphate aldolase